MKKLLSHWPLLFVLGSVLFNLILLFPETSIKMDLNDNVFAFTLIKRMDLTLSEIIKLGNLLNLPLLIDHWTPEWAQGYPVFSFYQHIPHLTVVILYRIMSPVIGLWSLVFGRLMTNDYSLMTVFNWLKYLMLSFYPIVIYFSARKFDFSQKSSALSAVVSTLVSTQYLYGTDYNALVFRGSGMYTQLWGIFFLPLALSYSYQFLKNNEYFFLAVIFISLALSGHLVFGYIAVLSTPLIVVSLLVSDILFIFRSDRHGDHLNAKFFARAKNLAKDKDGYRPVFFSHTNAEQQKIWRSQTSLREAKDLLAIVQSLMTNSYLKRLVVLLTACFLLLAYWLVPLLINISYQNKSLWDDYTKFNSYGANQIIKWLLNGQIFDNDRWPVLTILVAMGFFYSLSRFFENKNISAKRQMPKTNRQIDQSPMTNDPSANSQWPIVNSQLDQRLMTNDQSPMTSYLLIPLLFIFWLVLYFGRYTFGSFFILPLSDGLHGHRLINGVHIAGIFLIGFSGEWIYSAISRWLLAFGKKIKLNTLANGQQLTAIGQLLAVLVFICSIGIILFPVVKERYQYLSYNKELVNFNMALYTQEEKDFEHVSEKLKSLKAHRIYIGRPGNWGRNFNVGGFSSYFVASEDNLPTIGFEPESWSPNTDLEQFFSEYDPHYYNLYNIGYVVAPPEEKFGTDAKFMKKIAQYGKFVIYGVIVNKGGLVKPDLAPPGNFDFIHSDTLIYMNKKERFNLDRFWVDSPLMPVRNHPTITFKNNVDTTGYKNFLTMNGLSYYQLAKPGENVGYYNLFGANPFDPKNNLLKFNLATPSGTIISENFADNLYQATVETPQESLLMLKVTSHPFWTATIDGNKTAIRTVEPFFMAIKVPAGKHEVKFSYFPGWYKNVLMLLSLILLPGLYVFLNRYKKFLA